MPSLKVGQSYQATITTSDGSAVTALTATAASPGVVSITVAGNVATVHGVAAANTTIAYANPGCSSATENVTVTPSPSLIITDGPVS